MLNVLSRTDTERLPKSLILYTGESFLSKKICFINYQLLVIVLSQLLTSFILFV